MREPSPTPGFLVWRLATRWRVAVDRAVARFGLTHAQYAVLASLYGMNRSGVQPSQRQLADYVEIEPIYVSKLVRSLEHAGLVQRSGNPFDSRAVLLAVTPAGEDTARDAIAVVRELQQRLLAPFGGTRSERTKAFVRELQELLAVDLTHQSGLTPQREGANT